MSRLLAAMEGARWMPGLRLWRCRREKVPAVRPWGGARGPARALTRGRAAPEGWGPSGRAQEIGMLIA
ncbi:MAG: hypothetical protein QN157_08515 [Armatimonadota bacterium]|nr:hypothetical protein [Armatimonadota bacterium]